MAKVKKSVVDKRFSKNNVYSLKDGGKFISYSDGSKTNKNGSDKVSGYIPSTKENIERITRMNGKPERYGNRLIWW